MSNSDSSSISTTSHPLNSLSVNNIAGTITTNSNKLSAPPQVANQAANSVISTPGLTVPPQIVEQSKQVSFSKTNLTSTTIGSGVTAAPRHIIPTPTIITIATPTRASVSLSQTVKAPCGKHNLPVRPLPITLSHVASKASVTTSNTSCGDPGGGVGTKAVTIQPPLISGQIATKPKTYTYHLPNQSSVATVSNSHPAINVTTTRVAVVRPLGASPANRTLIPLAMATTSDTAKHTTKLTNVLHQPTSTISISIPAKSSTHAEASTSISRVSQAVRSIYQVGLSQTTSSSASPNIKPPRFLASQSGIKSNYSIPLLSNSVTSNNGPAFTYAASRHSSIATITTSAVSVAKVVPPQSTQRIHALHSVAPAISGHVRAQDLVAATLPIAATAFSQTSTTQQSVVQPSLLSSIPPTLYAPSPYVTNSHASVRSTLNVTVSNSSTLNDSIQINPAGVFVQMNPTGVFVPSTTNSSAPPFTQGQLLHSNNSTAAAKDQSRPISAHHPPATAAHLLNSSPKPAILRRPPRVENKQPLPASTTKKLIFDTQNNRSLNKSEHRSSGGVEAGGSCANYTIHEPVFSVVKPEIGSVGGFSKPIVTSNGISPASKLRTNFKEHSSSYSSDISKDLSISTTILRHPSNINNSKVKTEPGVQHAHFKIDTAAHLPSTTFNPSYHIGMNKTQDISTHPLVSEKIGIIQPHLGLVAGSLPPSHSPSLHQVNALSVGPIPRFPSSNLLQQKEIKTEVGSLASHSGVLKRDHDKISGEEPNFGLSPRKKPRKQTHIVAEELPDADHVIDEEMSTDDADECEDEIPLATLARDSTRATSTLAILSDSINDVKSRSLDQKSSEFIDKDGVRYVAARERPPITMLNGHRFRPVINHFIHYSDVKVKEKKVTLHDSIFNEKHMKGWKILQFASQLEELAALDADILERIVVIKEGLLQHVTSLLTHGKPKLGNQSPVQVRPNSTPPTPCSTPGQPKGFTSFVMSLPSASNNNVTLLNSPLTSNSERKTTRLREEVLKVEDKAQANIQRCRVMQEQLDEAKSLMLKVLKQRNLATKVVQVAREAQKLSKTTNGSSSRNSKKKKS